MESYLHPNVVNYKLIFSSQQSTCIHDDQLQTCLIIWKTTYMRHHLLIVISKQIISFLPSLAKLISHVMHISSTTLTFSVMFGQSTPFYLLIVSFIYWIMRITCFLIVTSIGIMGLYLTARINLVYDSEGFLVSIS